MPFWPVRAEVRTTPSNDGEFGAASNSALRFVSSGAPRAGRRPPAPGTAPTARVAALKMLAARRLTEAQVWQRLARRGYDDASIADAIARCRRDGSLDDRLFATLYVEGTSKALGDARLVAELVKRGIDREAARASVSAADRGEAPRLAAAIEKLFRTRPSVSFPSAARALERLGFPTSAVYRALRTRSIDCVPFGDLSDLHEPESEPRARERSG